MTAGSDAPIGIFDSGLGGLTVARAIFEHLPNESTIYFGDTARVPYGPKSPETVRRYSLEILRWLLQQGVKAVVIACNTSSAHALPVLRSQSPVPVLGVIDPGAAEAVRVCQGKPVGVIGTAGTIGSGAYERAIASLAPDLKVYSRACPLLVPLVEEGWFDHPATALVAEEYLNYFREVGVHTLVLGCTHYPLLSPLFQRLLGDRISLVDSATTVALELKAKLRETGMLTTGKDPSQHRFAVSDDPERFQRVGMKFLGAKLVAVETVPLSHESTPAPYLETVQGS